MTGVLLKALVVRTQFPASGPDLQLVGVSMNDFPVLDFKLTRRFDTELDYREICSRLQLVFRSLDIRFAQLGGRFICIVDDHHSFSICVAILEPRVFEICIDPIKEPVFKRHDYHLISRLLMLLEKATGAVSPRSSHRLGCRIPDTRECVLPIEVS